MIPFLILGLLQERPGSYGYELLASLKQRHYDYVIHFTKGSFYYNLQQLATKGLLESLPAATPTDKEQRYRVTPAGQAEFRRLFVKFGSVSDVTPLAFYGVWLFAPLAPDLMPQILTTQIAITTEKIEATEAALATPGALVPQYRTILQNTVAHQRLNLAWYRELEKK